MNAAATFAAIAATLYAAHQLADHVLGQTDRQAAHKAAPGWTGWRHLLGHVALYHLVMAVMTLTVVAVLHLPATGTGLITGLAFSAVSHAFLDRRWPVRWLLEHTGSIPFSRLADHGLNGMYLADQSLHYACLWLSALLIAAL
ncbi:DUF3307 domain-containing protein [Dactylosporangium vinaceum]|uniref:DUF3307 domain-containing protein n=1 Tax=Dactylosporangium vinaceum TaxID=53362 RepID=A0ABV5MIP4_9ACTN|nr:DUF3307 domain-containing protein [Dactylosporangium vinaceum]UAB95144.1 DUF3307 domain-containing protein [Dactylosporangium vinaceum]